MSLMNTDWDPNKARANSANHGVLFSDAEAVLYDPNGITRENDRAEGEQRFVTIGLDALGPCVGGGIHVSRRHRSDHFG